MKSFEDNLYDLYVNKKLNESGLNDYIYILLQKINSLKIKVMDLENANTAFQNKKNEVK